MKWVMVIILLLISNHVFGQRADIFGVFSIKEYKGYENLSVYLPLEFVNTLDTDKRLLEIRTKRFLKEEMDWELSDYESSGIVDYEEFKKTHPDYIELSSEIIPRELTNGRLTGYTIVCSLDILQYVDSKKNILITYSRSTWVTGGPEDLRDLFKKCNENLLDYLLLDYFRTW